MSLRDSNRCGFAFLSAIAALAMAICAGCQMTVGSESATGADVQRAISLAGQWHFRLDPNNIG